MKTIENNKLIAEFMGFRHELTYGYRIPYDGDLLKWVHDVNGGYWYKYSALKFYESWDWLIPVIERCYILNNEEDFNTTGVTGFGIACVWAP